MKKILSLVFPLILLSISLNAIAEGDASSDYSPCLSSPAVQEARSKELQELAAQDQKERLDLIEKHVDLDAIAWKEVFKNDLQRRKRVAEIFAEGCFKYASDYVAAALIYQHGAVPDHFYQTFIWGKRAVELGAGEKDLVALGLDRYLINTGRKQLFGTQFKFINEEPTTKCICLEVVEDSFPDQLRKEYLGDSLFERVDMMEQLYKFKRCSTLQCPNILKPTPAGTVPGFW